MYMTKARLAVLFLCAPVGVLACGGSSFNANNGADSSTEGSGPPPVTGEGGTDSANDTATQDVSPADTAPADATVDASVDSTIMPEDTSTPVPDSSVADTFVPPADTAPVDTGCPLVKADPSGVFVAAGGTAAGCTQASPCGTIQAGINAAASGGKTVYVAPGNYSESLVLAAGVTVSGGWSATTWTRPCSGIGDPAAVHITTIAADRVVSATSLGSAAKLDTLTLANDTIAAAGQSLYGVFVVGSSLTLSDVFVTVAAGGTGANGTGGGTGMVAASCVAGTGADGTTPGTPGMAGARGSYSSAGFSASSGTGGGNGTAGANGIAGTAGACIACATACIKDMPDGNVCASTSLGTMCAGTGLNGCGCSAGTAGTGGGGGGSSIGLFAWGDAQVTLTSGAIDASNGGNGGGGGTGGQGCTGSTGAQGSPLTCNTGCAAGDVYPNCSANMKGTAIGGAAGGPGGASTAGGSGGGGAGGDSFAYYVDATSMVLPSGTTLMAGSPGAGGGGAAMGPGGSAGPHN
jgi:hypothetical protein